jgi:acyl-CoA thioester hydrolase
MFKKVITPRVSETNITGHIGHTEIPVWLEEGYEEIIRLFSRNLAEPSLITVNMNIDFLHEIFFGKDVEILTGVKKIGTSSFILHQEIYQDSKLCVRASTTLVHFNYSTHKPDPIPKTFLDILKEHMSSGS